MVRVRRKRPEYAVTQVGSMLMWRYSHATPCMFGIEYKYTDGDLRARLPSDSPAKIGLY